MSTADFLTVAFPVFLAACLLLALRVRREYRTPRDESSWTGEGLDVRRIAPRIRLVRAGYVAEARRLPAHIRHRLGALAAARRALETSPFFRHAEHEEV